MHVHISYIVYCIYNLYNLKNICRYMIHMIYVIKMYSYACPCTRIHDGVEDQEITQAYE